MEIVTHIVAADDDEYQAVGDSINPLDEWSGIEAPRLDTIKIATLHSLLENVAIEVAATEEFETEQWDTEDIQEQLILLGDLAQLAESQGQALFVWMCLLQD